MTPGELQQLLFQQIRSKLPENASLAEETARLLDISTDSAYRRIRGEKTISLDELEILVREFQVSLDSLLKIGQDSILFQGIYMDKDKFSFADYLQSVIRNMGYINSFTQKYFYYLCKDLPIFHHYHFRDIAAFKWFFWLKTYFQFPGFEKRKFRFEDHPEELFILEQKSLEIYNQIPSAEIWNLESMNIFFRQIDFYRDGHVFESDRDVYRLYESIEKLWNHLERQAAAGYKFRFGEKEAVPQAEFKMYFNEVLLGDNNMMAELDGDLLSFVSHTTINFMYTRDEKFNRNMYNHIQNQIKRSTLISEVSEKERSRFFRIIRERITKRKESLKV
ncbi:MAG: helix-turn-helix domain-containing protein [Chitinophagaceae bacterium]